MSEPGPDRVAGGWAAVWAGGWLLSSGVLVAALTGLSVSRPDMSLAGRAGATELWPLWVSAGASWCCLSGLAWWLWQSIGGEVPSRRWWRAAAMVTVVAALVRVVTVLATPPVLSDDVWRYLNDGRTLWAGENPYRLAPTEIEPQDAAHAAILPRINHPHLVTIYQPTSQYVFAAAAGLHQGLQHLIGRKWDPLGDRTLRLVFCGFELVLIAVLLVVLRRSGHAAWWAVLYAWHPLALAEVAGTGHQEPVGLAFLALALMWATPVGQGLTWRRAVLAGAALALAVAVKPIVLPVAAILAWAHRGAPGRVAIAVGSAVAVGGLLYTPLALMPSGLSGMLETSGTFVAEWSFNAPLFNGVWGLFGGRQAASAVAAGLLGLVVLGLLWRGVEPWRAAGGYLLASLLLSSTAHPWYLLWALALLPVAFLPAVWVWSLTILWAYAALLDAQAYAVPGWVLLCEYAPVWAVLAWGLGRATRKAELELRDR